MRKNVHTYHRLLAQFKRYRRKLDRIDAGHSRYTKRDLLIKRLRALYVRIMNIKTRCRVASMRMAVAAGTVVGLSIVVPYRAHGQFQMKTDNVLRLAHVEDDAKPAFTDFDNDGDQDLFIGGTLTTFGDPSANGVAYYRNDEGKFFRAESPFPMDLGIEEVLVDTARVSPAFIDLDGDGDQDAFLGLSDGTMKYYRNDDGRYVLADSTENPFYGIRIGDSNDAVPVFVDLDGDGDMDAVIGKYTGKLAYYINEAGAFTEAAENPFGDVVDVTQNAAPAFADLDGDSDMDLVVGNKAGEIAYFMNNEGVFTVVDAANSPFADILVGDYSVPAFADIDSDGDQDLFVGDYYGDITYFRNDDGVFNQIERNQLGLAVLDGSNVHGFVDIDQDGDQDLFSGAFIGTIDHYINDDGMFSMAINNPLDTTIVKIDYNSAPTFADIDLDGDMDAFVGTYDQDILYLQNDEGVFSLVTGDSDPFNGIDAGANEAIDFADFDGDGDLDALIGNKIGQVMYFVNEGGSFAAAPEDNPFADVSFEVAGQPNHPVKPALVDGDGDGDMDAYFGTIDGTIRAFANMGEPGRSSAPVFVELTGEDNPFNGMDFGRAATPTAVDLDGDQDLDLVVSNALGLTFQFENLQSTSAREYKFSAETKVFPNPTNGRVQIEMPWIEQERATIRIHTADGRLLHQVRSRNHLEVLNLSQLPAGLYFLEITGVRGHAVKKVWKH